MFLTFAASIPTVSTDSAPSPASATADTNKLNLLCVLTSMNVLWKSTPVPTLHPAQTQLESTHVLVTTDLTAMDSTAKTLTNVPQQTRAQCFPAATILMAHSAVNVTTDSAKTAAVDVRMLTNVKGITNVTPLPLASTILARTVANVKTDSLETVETVRTLTNASLLTSVRPMPTASTDMEITNVHANLASWTCLPEPWLEQNVKTLTNATSITIVTVMPTVPILPVVTFATVTKDIAGMGLPVWRSTNATKVLTSATLTDDAATLLEPTPAAAFQGSAETALHAKMGTNVNPKRATTATTMPFASMLKAHSTAPARTASPEMAKTVKTSTSVSAVHVVRTPSAPMKLADSNVPA